MNSFDPSYIVDFSKFKENCFAVTSAFGREWGSRTVYGYSVKTNHDAELIKFAAKQLGWYIEVVSPDEYFYCKSLGIQPERMILNGPCKEDLLKQTADAIQYINLDNLDEVVAFCESPRMDCHVGLRVNFNLEDDCPGETTAGKEVSRFGIDAESHDLDDALRQLVHAGCQSIGLHMHTSTKSRSLGVFRALARKAVEIKQQNNIDFSFVDIGGGFFGGQKIVGKPSMEEYAKVICGELKAAFDPQSTVLILEPGASVLATCVTYRTSVINVRKIRNVNVVTLSGTLLHVNPFMASRKQPFVVQNDLQNRPVVDKQIVCGATCMENDRFAILEQEKELQKGDVLIFSAAGAYTMGLNSHFIFNPPAVEYIGE